MKRTLLWAIAAGLPALAFAQAPAKPDLAKAQQIVTQVCAACHGADGASPTSANPSLAGMPADYITTQLSHFKAGIRVWRAGDAANGIPACSACHGPAGAGLPKNFPRLGGQWADYTVAQLKAFRSGEPGSDPAGKDLNGKIMAGVARGMTDAQMKAVAEYAQGLK